MSSDALYFPFRLADCPPQPAALPIELSEVVCSHDSIYIAGVYRFFLPFLHINEGEKTLNYTEYTHIERRESQKARKSQKAMRAYR